ncbi:MAG TPA: hypothetical protein VMU34_18935, partial [Mycobacterium sp.]|nr:hypothetical protein [Mycobacterium sp.]
YARRLLPLLRTDMLVLVDRGSDAEAFLADLAGTGAQFLARLRNNRKLPVLARLDDGSHLSRIGELAVRIITADLTVTCADGTRYTATYRLTTTLCDPRHYRARRLIAVYHERWEHEIAYLALHHTLAEHRVLRSADPAGLNRNCGPCSPLPGAAPSHGHRHRIPPRHRPGPGQLHHRPPNHQRPAGQRRQRDRRHRSRRPHRPSRASRPAPATTATQQRPQGQIPALALQQERPPRPDPSTPITSITATIDDPEPKYATREPESLTTALGP